MKNKDYNERVGKGVRWSMSHRTCMGESEIRGYTVDNLDTKGLEEAQNNYEEVFIRIRETLRGKPWCCDSEQDILSICQALADDLRENLLIRK